MDGGGESWIVDVDPYSEDWEFASDSDEPEPARDYTEIVREFRALNRSDLEEEEERLVRELGYIRLYTGISDFRQIFLEINGLVQSYIESGWLRYYDPLRALQRDPDKKLVLKNKAGDEIPNPDVYFPDPRVRYEPSYRNWLPLWMRPDNASIPEGVLTEAIDTLDKISGHSRTSGYSLENLMVLAKQGMQVLEKDVATGNINTPYHPMFVWRNTILSEEDARVIGLDIRDIRMLSVSELPSYSVRAPLMPGKRLSIKSILMLREMGSFNINLSAQWKSLLEDRNNIEDHLKQMLAYLVMCAMHFETNDVRSPLEYQIYMSILFQSWEQAVMYFEYMEMTFFPWMNFFFYTMPRWIDAIAYEEASVEERKAAQKSGKEVSRPDWLKKLHEEATKFRERNRFYQLKGEEGPPSSIYRRSGESLSYFPSGEIDEFAEISESTAMEHLSEGEFESEVDDAVENIGVPDHRTNKKAFNKYIQQQRERYQKDPSGWNDWYNSQMKAYKSELKRTSKAKLEARRSGYREREVALDTKLKDILRKMRVMKNLKNYLVGGSRVSRRRIGEPLSDTFEDAHLVNALATPEWNELRRLTLENEEYRVIHDYTPQSELVLMSVPPSSNVPEENHPGVTQFIRVERGIASIYSDTFPEGIDIHEGEYMFVEPGENHEIVNESAYDFLKLYTIYSPPEHTKEHDAIPEESVGTSERRGI